MFIVGVDVGGTFTDLTAVDETTGRVVVTKVPSEPRNEAGALLAGLRALGIESREVRRLVHGTTVGTNAVLERRGARVAVLCPRTSAQFAAVVLTRGELGFSCVLNSFCCSRHLASSS